MTQTTLHTPLGTYTLRTGTKPPPMARSPHKHRRVRKPCRGPCGKFRLIPANQAICDACHGTYDGWGRAAHRCGGER